jgi:hypothetical protein
MDPISLGASLIAFGEIAQKVLVAICKYVSALRSAPQELKDLINEVSAVKGVVSGIEAILQARKEINRNDPELEALTNVLAMPVKDCISVLEALQEMFIDLEDCSEMQANDAPVRLVRGSNIKTALRERATAVKKAMLLPGKLEEVRALLNRLDRSKATLSLALDMEEASAIASMQEKLQHVGQDVQQMLLEQKRFTAFEKEKKNQDSLREVRNWLCPIEPAAKHADVSNRRQPGTGGWLLEHEKFMSFVSGETPFLWITGIGKFDFINPPIFTAI